MMEIRTVLVFFTALLCLMSCCDTQTTKSTSTTTLKPTVTTSQSTTTTVKPTTTTTQSTTTTSTTVKPTTTTTQSTTTTSTTVKPPPAPLVNMKVSSSNSKISPTITTQSKVNWCDPELLKRSSKHLACKHSGKFCKSCIKPQDVPMTDEFKKVILFEHNKFRNLIAGGKLPKCSLPTAIRMKTLEWNVDLEYLASLNCKSCQFEHDDKSIVVPLYSEVLQNIGIRWTRQEREEIDIPDLLEERIANWASEIDDLKPEVFKLPPGKDDPNRSKYGHAAAMIKDGLTQIGCAVSQFIDTPFTSVYNASYIVCNYAGDLSGEEIYDVGKPVAKCIKGKNSEWPYLCHKDENKCS